MKEEVKKWIEIANIDFYSAKELLNSDEPLTLTACFHSQQAIEKYLKAYLVFKNKEFTKTHNISELLKLCIDIDIEFEILKELKIYELTIYATHIRYPDNFYIPTLDEAKEAIELAEKTKEFVLKKLGK